ncbi:MAG: PQQ-binding-like beta-propeller repeat protein [Thermomicrobiales bacterium]
MTERTERDDRDAISRRTLIATGGAAIGAAIIGTSVLNASAQDATPESVDGVNMAVQATPEGLGPAIPPEVTEFANDWPVAQGNLAATRTAASSTIDSTTVSQLGIAWTLPLDAVSGYGAITSNPVVQGDTVYLIDNEGNVKALDKETGAIKWKNDYNVQTAGPNGVAVGYGYCVSVLGDDATVVCVMADTGEEVWRYRLGNHNALGITMAPLIYDSYIIVSTEPGGNTKGNYEGGAAGVVFCLDLATGVTRWQFDTTQNLWNNFAVNSGGGLWYPPSVDENGILYLGVANAAPFPDASTRPGPNDYANSTVALDPAAGGIKWYLNVRPHDLVDHDNQQTPVLGTAEIDGVETNIVFSSGKYGYVVAIDRETGVELWRTAVGKHENDDLTELPADDPVIIFPGVYGGVESPIAYDKGVIYAASLNVGTGWTATTLDFMSMNLGASTGNVTALDAATGAVIWNVDVPIGIAGPGPTIANDVLFTGGLDGIVRAYNTADGSQVWSYQTTAGINACYAIAGDYLFVPAGSFILPSSDTQGTPPTPSAKLYAFKIGATGVDATPTA